MDTPGIDAILTDIFLFKYLSVILLKKLIPGFKKTNRINMERYEEKRRGEKWMEVKNLPWKQKPESSDSGHLVNPADFETIPLKFSTKSNRYLGERTDFLRYYAEFFQHNSCDSILKTRISADFSYIWSQ